MSSIARGPAQRVSKNLVAIADQAAIHKPSNFFEELANRATKVSATVYTIANDSDFEDFLSSLAGGGGNNWYVDEGRVVTDFGQTVTVSVAGEAMTAVFQRVGVNTNSSLSTDFAPTNIGYAIINRTFNDNSNSNGRIRFARI